MTTPTADAAPEDDIRQLAQIFVDHGFGSLAFLRPDADPYTVLHLPKPTDASKENGQ